MHHPGPQGGLVYRIKYCVPYLQSVGFVHAAANVAKSALDAPAVGGYSEMNDVLSDPALPESVPDDMNEAAKYFGRLGLD
ncbi:hypothetical protein B0H14DRAFT_3496851 [Mycena olivaceomarginata]|nr:hypothetical protein B0H14DRAFT_3496851 [Mycena olivaceomarginata]